MGLKAIQAAVLAGAAGVGLAAGSAQAALVVNGGFETGDFTGWTWSGNLNDTGVNADSAYSGSFGAYLGPAGTPGSLSQTIDTIPGVDYTLSFDLRNDGPAPNTFLAAIDGNQMVSLVDADPFAWTHYSGVFTAAGTSTRIELGFRNDTGWWYVDNIAVVPEPASLVGMGAAAGLLLARRRRVK